MSLDEKLGFRARLNNSVYNRLGVGRLAEALTSEVKMPYGRKGIAYGLSVAAVCLALACGGGSGGGGGDDNNPPQNEAPYKSPYHAPYGSTVNAPDSKTFNSTGGSYIVSLPVYVLDKNTKPINDIAVKVWIMPSGSASDYSAMLGTGMNIGDFVGGGQDSWDKEDGMPIYKTNRHGRADVQVLVPYGFAGVIDLIFDIGVDDAEIQITISPAGGSCFDGEDNNSDGFIDAQDPFCTGPDATEPE